MNIEFVKKALKGVANPRPMNHDYERLQLDSIVGSIDDKNKQVEILKRISNIVPRI